MKIFILFASVVSLSFTQAQQHQNGNMYLLYNNPPGKFYNIDQEITPEKLAPGTFWALTLGFNEQKEGAYIGVQTDYSDSNKGMFIFSIWNAIDVEKGDMESFTVDFGGEGEGKSCRLSIPLIPSHTYRLRIWQLETNSTGTFWGAWILDKSIGKEYYLGKIKTALQTTLSSRASNFVEYYGAIKPCNYVPHSKARFNSIKFNCNSDNGTCEKTYHPINYRFGECVGGFCTLDNNHSNVSFGNE